MIIPNDFTYISSCFQALGQNVACWPVTIIANCQVIVLKATRIIRIGKPTEPPTRVGNRPCFHRPICLGDVCQEAVPPAGEAIQDIKTAVQKRRSLDAEVIITATLSGYTTVADHTYLGGSRALLTDIVDKLERLRKIHEFLFHLIIY